MTDTHIETLSGADTASATDSVTDASTGAVTTYTDIENPTAFTHESLGWVPWLTPLREDELEQRHWDGLVHPARAKLGYFALLVRDPETLGARTRTDNDIFYNTDGGLPRAERELSAAATSRVNGCVFCASVHARAAAKESGRVEDVQRLLDEGVGADIDPRWNAIITAAAALAATPPAFDSSHVAALREVGLDDVDIADAINGASFFNWANRLMLSLGEPQVPARRGGST